MGLGWPTGWGPGPGVGGLLLIRGAENMQEQKTPSRLFHGWFHDVLSGMRLLACLIVAPQRGYDEPAILSYAISSFCPTSADGLQGGRTRDHRHRAEGIAPTESAYRGKAEIVRGCVGDLAPRQ